MFFCAISGEVPQDPVVSAKSGHVYERRLIEKYLNDTGTDPVTGVKLDGSDLIAVKASPNATPPRAPSQTSIPALLQTLQNEWDALMLETFTLKQQYNLIRQELSYALHAEQAATLVVARLLKERDAAREALARVQASPGVTSSAPSGSDIEMADEVAGGLPAGILSQISEARQTLSGARKNRKSLVNYTIPAEVKTFKMICTIPSLNAASSAGVTALAVSRANPSHFLTGGNDKIVQLYDRDTDNVLATLKGHTKKVNHVTFREKDGEPTLLISGGADKMAKIWSYYPTSGDLVISFVRGRPRCYESVGLYKCFACR